VGTLIYFLKFPNEISTKVDHAQSSSLLTLSTPLGISLNEFQKLIFVYICACVMKFFEDIIGNTLEKHQMLNWGHCHDKIVNVFETFKGKDKGNCGHHYRSSYMEAFAI